MLAIGGMLIAALLQSTVVESLPPAWPQPDIVAVLVFGWASLKGRLPGLRAALLGGLMLDILGSNPLGLAVLVLLPGAYLAGWLREQLTEPIFAANVLSVIIGSALASFGQAGYLAAMGGLLSWQTLILRSLLPSAVGNGLVSVLLLPLLHRFAEGAEREPAAFLRRTLPKGLLR
jgi:rod shape-determining protein MreD